MSAARCLVFGVSCLSFVVCWFLLVGCYVSVCLFARLRLVCCSLFAVSCALFVVGRSSYVVVGCLMPDG